MAKFSHTKQEKKLMERMANVYGCIICRKELGVFTPSSIHHFRHGVGMSQRSRLFIPLCYHHHQHPEHGIHGGTKSWIKKHGTEQELLDYYYATVEEDYQTEL
jgi:hypothetical protein